MRNGYVLLRRVSNPATQESRESAKAHWPNENPAMGRGETIQPAEEQLCNQPKKHKPCSHALVRSRHIARTARLSTSSRAKAVLRSSERNDRLNSIPHASCASVMSFRTRAMTASRNPNRSLPK